jgi:hypothetical protein
MGDWDYDVEEVVEGDGVSVGSLGAIHNARWRDKRIRS